MSASDGIFIGFTISGLLFFFIACLLAARPASGTTEWISFKCGKSLTFCPTPKSFSKLDLIPMLLLTVSAFGTMCITVTVLPQFEAITPLSQLSELLLFRIGNSSFCLTQLFWVITVPVAYIFIKNLTGGFLIPSSCTALIMLDIHTLVLSRSSGAVGASLFVLIAFYLAYRYATLSDGISYRKKAGFFPAMWFSIGIAAAFYPSAAIAAVIGIIALYITREIFSYRANKTGDNRRLKKHIIIQASIIIPCSIILPFTVSIAVNTLCTIRELSDITISIANVFNTFARCFSFAKSIGSSSDFLIFAPVIFVSSLFAIPCCIYQVIYAKDGNSLFALILLFVYLITIFLFNCTGLTPIFGLPIIAQCFTAIYNRNRQYWIIVFLSAALLYLGFVITAFF